MKSRNEIGFVAFAVANGIASGASFAGAATGHWLVCAAALAASLAFAVGMIKTVGSLRPSR
jgi:hypothetical protein